MNKIRHTHTYNHVQRCWDKCMAKNDIFREGMGIKLLRIFFDFLRGEHIFHVFDWLLIFFIRNVPEWKRALNTSINHKSANRLVMLMVSAIRWEISKFSIILNIIVHFFVSVKIQFPTITSSSMLFNGIFLINSKSQLSTRQIIRGKQRFSHDGWLTENQN